MIDRQTDQTDRYVDRNRQVNKWVFVQRAITWRDLMGGGFASKGKGGQKGYIKGLAKRLQD